MNVLVDGRNPNDPTLTTPYTVNLGFTAAGQLDLTALASPDFTVNADGTLVLTNWTPAAPDTSVPPVWSANGANAAAAGVTIDIRDATQFASAFAVTAVSQDGYTTGELSGLEIDDTGVIFARYTNGQSLVQGQVVLASFANVQGLTPVGKTAWVQSFQSGEPVVGTPRSGTLGALQAGALEDSNVELSDQLVNLIVAQRNYQANAKTIETESAITQTIINLR
jgi:flagellar hook protein FlgE